MVLAAPLPFVSVVLWASYNGLFRTAQKVLSLRAATDLDNRDQVRLLVEQHLLSD